MTSMVVGAMGFVGQAIVARLVRDGEKVLAFDSTVPEISRQDGVQVVQGDVSRMSDVLAAMKDHGPIHRIIDVAYMLGDVAERRPFMAMHVNVLGVVNVFEAARLLGVPRVVFVSSQGAYGPQEQYGDRILSEDDYPSAGKLLLNYCHTKLLNEYVAAQYAQMYDLDIRVIRGAVIFGHGRSRATAWSTHFASLPAADESVTLPFPHTDRACMIYVEDFAEQVVCLANASAPQHRLYNAGGHTVTGTAMAEAVRAVIPKAQIEFSEDARPLPYAYLIDGTRFENEFGIVLPPFEDRVRDHIQQAQAETGGS